MSRVKQIEAKLAEYVRMTGRGNMERANMIMVDIIHLLKPGLGETVEQDMIDSAPIDILPPRDREDDEHGLVRPDPENVPKQPDPDLLDRVVGHAEALVSEVHELEDSIKVPEEVTGGESHVAEDLVSDDSEENDPEEDVKSEKEAPTPADVVENETQEEEEPASSSKEEENSSDAADDKPVNTPKGKRGKKGS